MTNSQANPPISGSPLARPAAPESRAAQRPVTAVSGPIATPKQSPLTGATSAADGTVSTVAKRHRVGRAMRRTLANQLSDHDWSVLASLARYRFLHTYQISELHLPGGSGGASQARAVRRQLLRLARWKLIRPVTARRVGGLHGGADPHIWQLTAAGKAVVTGGTPGRISSYPSTRFLTHTLAIAETAIGLRRATAGLGGTVDIQLEREAARRLPNAGGGTTKLTPDLFAVVRAADETGQFEDAWFIEVDCGTESLPTLLGKCEQYEAYRRSGIEQLDHDGVFPLVLWIFHGPTGATRRDELRRRLERGSSFTDALYRYATPDQLAAVLTGGGL